MMNYLVAADQCFLDAPAGMERVAWDMACAVRDAGHRVTLLSAMPPGRTDLPACAEAEGLNIVRYPRPVLPAWHPRRGHRLIRAAAQAAQEHLAAQPWDVVHIHSPFTGLGVKTALGTGPRYVYTVHSPVLMEQRINWASQGLTGRLKLLLGSGTLCRIEGGLLRQMDGIQALSEYTREQLDGLYGIGSRISVVPHWRKSDARRTCSPPEARRRLGWPEEGPILFTVRRHGPRYGLDVAIRAVAPLAQQGRCRFVVAGSGPLTPALKSLAAELGASKQITFPGRVSDEELALSYQAADLFILPTVALECFGLIALEAFSYGLPVLGTDVGAIPETVRPILPDFIVPGGDVEALRAKLGDFLDGTLKAPAQTVLVDYVEERFGKDVVLPRLLKLMGL
jgi:glycosyltransferase involved in cell wall biosynthesis